MRDRVYNEKSNAIFIVRDKAAETVGDAKSVEERVIFGSDSTSEFIDEDFFDYDLELRLKLENALLQRLLDDVRLENAALGVLLQKRIRSSGRNPSP